LSCEEFYYHTTAGQYGSSLTAAVAAKDNKYDIKLRNVGEQRFTITRQSADYGYFIGLSSLETVWVTENPFLTHSGDAAMSWNVRR
jgi:hypothetical protein